MVCHLMEGNNSNLAQYSISNKCIKITKQLLKIYNVEREISTGSAAETGPWDYSLV